MFTARLVNSPEQDPALLLDLPGQACSYLVDCGTLQALSLKDLLRVRRLFVTHTHIDHWCGFDHLVRMQLFSPQPLDVYGPVGIGAQVAARLAGYSWNLVSRSQYVIHVHELPGNSTRLPCQNGFAPEALETPTLVLPDGPTLTYAPVEHGVPCLAFVLRWPARQQVDRQGLATLGWKPGPWLEELKQRTEGDLTVNEETRSIPELRDLLLRPRPGASLAYMTDTLCSKPVMKAMIKLAAHVDEFWCEAAYLHQHAELAREKLHMTARQAARLAHEAKVGKLYLFHQSRRYHAAIGEHVAEARAVFAETHPPPQVKGN